MGLFQCERTQPARRVLVCLANVCYIKNVLGRQTDRQDRQRLADLVGAKARRKTPDLIKALEDHKMEDDHRFLIGQAVPPLAFLESETIEMDDEILPTFEP